ncbi:MAG: hypothetical protein L0H26_00830 [Microlunatus sp.]|nr:hypothetical protein [Microlunatus sp.]
MLWVGRLGTLFEGLVDDAAVFPPGDAPVAEAVRRHLDHQASWYADLVGPLVVPDMRLAEVSRAVTAADAADQLAVSVVNTGGAGGLLAVARRELPGVRVVSVEAALRDLDNLTGSAARVIAAAAELDPDVAVFVEIPFQRGWIGAVEEIEAAGLLGKIRIGGPDRDAVPAPDQLAEQLSELIEADLGFKATAGLPRAWPHQGQSRQAQTSSDHGFLTVLLAIKVLIDGAGTAEAAELLRLEDRERIVTALSGWDAATEDRVRRRFRSFGCCRVTGPVDDLVALGLLSETISGPDERTT